MKKNSLLMNVTKYMIIDGNNFIINKKKNLFLDGYEFSTLKRNSLIKKTGILNKDIYIKKSSGIILNLEHLYKKYICSNQILGKDSLKYYSEEKKNLKNLEDLDLHKNNEYIKDDKKNEGILMINNKNNRDTLSNNINFSNRLLEKNIISIQKNNRKINSNILKYYLNNYLELSKSKLTLWVTLSSTFGYFMLGGSSLKEFSALVVGVFLCSSSANTFNQIRERNIDKIMKRTQKRPLANNKISLKHAEIFGFTSAITGSLILYFFNNPLTSYLGIFNIILYACLYTPLKLKTPYNTHIGSIVGSIPTLMGCTAVEQNLFLPEPWILFITQFLWQFPHFYSLAYLYKEDYIKGKYKMFPLQDKNGIYTAKLCRPYIIGLSLLPLIFFFCGYTSYMYILTSLIPNLFIYYKFQNFLKKPSKCNIRSFFKHSLWHIILLLALSAYHTQIPDKNENNSRNIKENNKDTKENSLDHSITKFKKKLLKFCIVFS
ncbi:cytochrome c oxidase assembly protein (heme A: farnesyltransferase), putative [Plasmodium gallinaceum]|uniref:Protoheme IX farnesyltransferase, mitochondrial n=1 Tax=Plasmodium gallinaceum TaxID=5849 RepID=A0A1J1GKX1_PLAGA|nr:cytochrome c oxidase assembly protein (heme A: farnesyltransferase), putative [Plasmodium gallinaceum]CRG92963.1 cytochrome c oxidase assembly protein (heme A: farnesyltransferase), putative [Plasmodium gallinaceum]